MIPLTYDRVEDQPRDRLLRKSDHPTMGYWVGQALIARVECIENIHSGSGLPGPHMHTCIHAHTKATRHPILLCAIYYHRAVSARRPEVIARCRLARV